MKIVVNNREFEYDFGIKLLKLKNKQCPFEEIQDIWDDVMPATFNQILKLKNLEDRRVGIACLETEALLKEVKAELIDKQTLKKSTTYIDVNGKLVSKDYEDVYELYKINGKDINLDDGWRNNIYYFVKCKCTSTGREYILWVDERMVKNTNNINHWQNNREINAIDAIAWTFQTTVPEENIEKIIRQGDCIFVKPINKYKPLPSPRHLTGNEYKELLTIES